jgi:hypothetical protein
MIWRNSRVPASPAGRSGATAWLIMSARHSRSSGVRSSAPSTASNSPSTRLFASVLIPKPPSLCPARHRRAAPHRASNLAATQARSAHLGRPPPARLAHETRRSRAHRDAITGRGYRTVASVRRIAWVAIAAPSGRSPDRAASVPGRARWASASENPARVGRRHGPRHERGLEQQPHEPLGIAVETEGMAVLGELGEVAREDRHEERRHERTHRGAAGSRCSAARHPTRSRRHPTRARPGPGPKESTAEPAPGTPHARTSGGLHRRTQACHPARPGPRCALSCSCRLAFAAPYAVDGGGGLRAPRRTDLGRLTAGVPSRRRVKRRPSGSDVRARGDPPHHRRPSSAASAVPNVREGHFSALAVAEKPTALVGDRRPCDRATRAASATRVT